MTNRGHRTVSGFLTFLVLLCLAPALGAQQLELGGVITSQTSDSKIADFAFDAPSAGVLTVVVRSTGDTDLVLFVTDMDGQPLPDARSDQDFGGDRGAEQVAVTIPRAGSYRIRVEPYSMGVSQFKIGASWVSFPDLEIPADPDGSPSTATVIQAGQPIDDSIDGSVGDHWDWFVFTAEQAGTVTLTTRADEGDLVLEAFEVGEYADAVDRSDQDLQGVSGNEALTQFVQAGQKVFFKVFAWSEGAQIAYRLQAGFMPE